MPWITLPAKELMLSFSFSQLFSTLQSRGIAVVLLRFFFLRRPWQRTCEEFYFPCLPRQRLHRSLRAEGSDLWTASGRGSSGRGNGEAAYELHLLAQFP